MFRLHLPLLLFRRPYHININLQPLWWSNIPPSQTLELARGGRTRDMASSSVFGSSRLGRCWVVPLTNCRPPPPPPVTVPCPGSGSLFPLDCILMLSMGLEEKSRVRAQKCSFYGYTLEIDSVCFRRTRCTVVVLLERHTMMVYIFHNQLQPASKAAAGKMVPDQIFSELHLLSTPCLWSILVKNSGWTESRVQSKCSCEEITAEICLQIDFV